MYKCKDCGSEYIDKPEYCDCGNNSFEEIVTQDSAEEFVEKDIEKVNPKKNFFEQYPKLKEFLNSLDIISTSIFALCLILSMLAWIFIGKDDSHIKSSTKPTHHLQKQVKQENIPDLDSFWNDTSSVEKPKIEEPSPIEVPTPIPNTAPSEPVSELNKSQPQAPVTITKTKQNNNVVKPSAVSKKAPSLNPSAMSAYKNSLRHALFSRLAVTSVLGVGRCEIEFSVDKSGKLLGRKFSKLSDNKSLNDAVYNMLMSLPQFTPPPTGYNGEKIRLSFYFNNGYYEVSY